MVAVRKFADSQQNEFTWFRYITIPGYQREEPEHFTFKEEPDYRPVFVEVDPLHDYRELAVMVDGDCYGAAVVDGETVMVPAYIDSVPDGAQIQIVGWDGSKSKSDPLELQIYNSNTEEFYPAHQSPRKIVISITSNWVRAMIAQMFPLRSALRFPITLTPSILLQQ